MISASDYHYASDVCVIGSGVAGAIVASECVAAGLNVVMVEAGGRWRRRVDVRVLDHVLGKRGSRTRPWLRVARYDEADHRSMGHRRYPLREAALIVRGGATLVWSGFAYRMQPEDFRLRHMTGIGEDWPISYADLERHYRRAEQTLRVQGDHTDSGHPPRSGPFPLAPSPHEERDQIFASMVGPDWVMHHNAAARLSGLPIAADRMLDELDKRRGFALISNCVARRLVLDGSRKCIAVDARKRRGQTVRVEADTVVVCGGGVESPKLLSASRTSQYPDGLGNQGGQLGRNLVSHTGVTIGGRLPSDLTIGSITPTAASRRWDTDSEQRKGKYVLLWRPHRSAGMALNAALEQHPHDGNRIERAAGTDRFGLPRTVVHFEHDVLHAQRTAEVAERLRRSVRAAGMCITIDNDYVHAHPMCTTRMSDDPTKGVVDRDLRVHGLDNVFVCGSSSFTTGGAAHPTMTVAALAHRLGGLLTRGPTSPQDRNGV